MTSLGALGQNPAQEAKGVGMPENLGEMITLAEAARAIPGRPSISTVWRWIRNGIRIWDGNRIRLRHFRIGRRIYVRRADLERFFREIADHDWEQAHTKCPPRKSATTPSRKERSLNTAEALLADAGIVKVLNTDKM